MTKRTKRRKDKLSKLKVPRRRYSKRRVSKHRVSRKKNPKRRVSKKRYTKRMKGGMTDEEALELAMAASLREQARGPEPAGTEETEEEEKILADALGMTVEQMRQGHKDARAAKKSTPAREPAMAPETTLALKSAKIKEPLSTSPSPVYSKKKGDVLILNAPKRDPARVPAMADLEPEPAPMSDTGPIKIGLIRHSFREDNDPTGQEWPDKSNRPYDPPISFKHPYTSPEELPEEKARELQEYNFTRIISSPFRRCLQTAAIIAKNLGIKTIDVDKGIGEAMSMVSRAGGKPKNFNYLLPEQMNGIIQGASDGIARIGSVSGKGGAFDQVDAAVIRSNFDKLKDEILNNPVKQNVLLVTHGDVIGQTLDIVNGETVFEVDYCAWIIYEEDGITSSKLKLAAKNGVNSIKLS